MIYIIMTIFFNLRYYIKFYMYLFVAKNKVRTIFFQVEFSSKYFFSLKLPKIDNFSEKKKRKVGSQRN